MVLHATYDNRLAVELDKYASDIVIQFVTYGGSAQEGTAVFGGEDSMDDDF